MGTQEKSLAQSNSMQHDTRAVLSTTPPTYANPSSTEESMPVKLEDDLVEETTSSNYGAFQSPPEPMRNKAAKKRRRLTKQGKTNDDQRLILLKNMAASQAEWQSKRLVQMESELQLYEEYIKIQREELQLQKELDDREVMLMDFEHLTPIKKRYFTKRKQQILDELDDDEGGSSEGLPINNSDGFYPRAVLSTTPPTYATPSSTEESMPVKLEDDLVEETTSSNYGAFQSPPEPMRNTVAKKRRRLAKQGKTLDDQCLILLKNMAASQAEWRSKRLVQMARELQLYEEYIKIKREELQLQKELDDREVMLMDFEYLTPIKKRYFTKRKQQILDELDDDEGGSSEGLHINDSDGFYPSSPANRRLF